MTHRVSEDELRAAMKIDQEYAFKVNLGIVNRHDEAIDGCTVYEPDGWCPHGRLGLHQIRALYT